MTADETIDYLEFIMATMHMNRMDREDHLHTAFQYFDKDSSGYITEEELEPAVKNHGTWQMSRSLSQGPFNIF
jgi:calcium-dependent protein kinase